MKKRYLLKIVTIIIFSVINNVSALQFSADDIYTNNNGVEMTHIQITNLKNLGYKEDEIRDMFQDEFDENKNLEGKVVSSVTKYYKTETYIPTAQDTTTSINYFNSDLSISNSYEITKEEYEDIDNQVMTLGLEENPVNTEYKEMTASIIKVNNRYRYVNTVRWKKLPTWQQRDIIGIGFDNKVYGISSTKRLTAYFTYDNTSDSNATTTGTWELSPTGYGVSFKWPNPSFGAARGFLVRMYFEVEKNTTDPINVLNAYGNYRHGKSWDNNLICSFSVSYIIGVGANFEDKYDNISTSQATLTGIQW
ncbi:MAG TPA: hypothetical protein DCE23_09530 [Firmicutes bacterium]|nr:hypothetical protein [Bacillota bacterium]